MTTSNSTNGPKYTWLDFFGIFLWSTNCWLHSCSPWYTCFGDERPCYFFLSTWIKFINAVTHFNLHALKAYGVDEGFDPQRQEARHKVCIPKSFILAKTIPMTWSIVHVPTKLIKGGFSTFRLDVNGVILGATTSIFQTPLFSTITMITLRMWPSFKFSTYNHFMWKWKNVKLDCIYGIKVVVNN